MKPETQRTKGQTHPFPIPSKILGWFQGNKLLRPPPLALTWQRSPNDTTFQWESRLSQARGRPTLVQWRSPLSSSGLRPARLSPPPAWKLYHPAVPCCLRSSLCQLQHSRHYFYPTSSQKITQDRGKTAWKEISESECMHTRVHTHASTDTTHAHVHIDPCTTQHTHMPHTHTHTHTHTHKDSLHTHIHRNHTTHTEAQMHTRTTQHTQTPTHRHIYTTQHTCTTHTYTHSTNHRHFARQRSMASVEAWGRIKRCAEGVAMKSEGNTEAAHGNPRG